MQCDQVLLLTDGRVLSSTTMKAAVRMRISPMPR